MKPGPRPGAQGRDYLVSCSIRIIGGQPDRVHAGAQVGCGEKITLFERCRKQLRHAARNLAPDQLLGTLYTQLGPLTRLPRRLGQLADRIETGTLKVGVAPTELEGLEHVLRSVANRVGAAIIVVGLLLSSALIARVHDLQWLGFAGVCLASVLGLYMIWKIVRTPGEL